jgi:oligoendopeptidase F
MSSTKIKQFKYFSEVEVAALPAREEIDEKYIWNLNDIYNSDEDWELDFKWIENNLSGYSQYIGNLNTSSDTLLACLKFDDSIGIRLERLYLYAMLAKDGDMRVNKYQGMDDRIKALYTKVSTESSFIKPELLEISDDVLLGMIDSNEELKVYRHFIKNLIRTKWHSLSKPEEHILALSSEISQTPYNSYSMFTNADLKFSTLPDEQGSNIEMSHARFYSAMYSKDRDYRERAFKSYLAPYKDYVNTFTTLFNGNLKTNIFFARARKYNSAREASLDKNNIPIQVYDNLVEEVNKNLSPLHRWAELKKNLLGLDKLKPFDVYVTVFDKANEKKYSYEEAKEIVFQSLKVMGEDYLSSLQLAFDNRWIDVYETKAKKSGAYSSGTTFGVHPYVLLNWTDLLNDVFTLTHEMGHNMHSYYTGKTQPYPYANYSIFLAEVASTFNESLLLDHLTEYAEDSNEKLYLLEKSLNNITSTFYRQVMFAEFEMMVYNKTEKGEALTWDILCQLYKDIYQKYWGAAMEIDVEEEFTWARIPHFYYNFYVFQYATGFAASSALAIKVKTEGTSAVEKYLSFLKAGSSDYPINILKDAGVEMSSSEPILTVSAKMDQLLTEMEKVIANN